jgi:hypothetical protein
MSQQDPHDHTKTSTYLHDRLCSMLRAARKCGYRWPFDFVERRAGDVLGYSLPGASGGLAAACRVRETVRGIEIVESITVDPRKSGRPSVVRGVRVRIDLRRTRIDSERF